MLPLYLVESGGRLYFRRVMIISLEEPFLGNLGMDYGFMEYGFLILLEPPGPEARARVFVHVLYEFWDY